MSETIPSRMKAVFPTALRTTVSKYSRFRRRAG
jgi:hypothetical protein